MSDAIRTAWADRVYEAIGLATREHTARLNAESFPAYDGQGIHIYSSVCGEIRALEGLAPDLFAHPAISFDALGVRQAAREGAVADFEAEKEADWRLRFLLSREAVAA